MSVYDENAFSERVNLAAAYIAAGRSTTRTFDTCFEMHDGAAVAAALLRRAEKNPQGNLARNLFKFLSESVVRQDAEALAHVPTRDLPRAAAEIRAKAREEFEAFMARRYG